MLDAPTDPDEDSAHCLIGADHTGPLELTLADLRRAAARANHWCRQQASRPGDSVLLVRLPHSSEVPARRRVIALMSVGIRVVLPMSFDRTQRSPTSQQATACRGLALVRGCE